MPDQSAAFFINELSGDVRHHCQVGRLSLRGQLLLLYQFILLAAFGVVLLNLVEVTESLRGRVIAVCGELIGSSCPLDRVLLSKALSLR
jgi:hypothetical protein